MTFRATGTKYAQTIVSKLGFSNLWSLVFFKQKPTASIKLHFF